MSSSISQQNNPTERNRPSSWFQSRRVQIASVGVFATGVLSVIASVRVQAIAIGGAVSLLCGWLFGSPKGDATSVGTIIERPTSDSSSRWETEWGDLWALTRSLGILRDEADPLLQEYVVLVTADLKAELQRLARGELVFRNTETWRAAYERVLSSPEITRYRSVSWIKTQDYWQDLPGQQSLRFNFELVDRGVTIERIIILGWNLWPPAVKLPLPIVQRWIDDQHYRGISISLVRESDLMQEPELQRDFGIYGERATGEQDLDEQSRTVQFILSFDPQSLRISSNRWDRLLLFSVPYGNLLDPDTHAR